MTDIVVSAKKLYGKVTPPPFKSEVIRYLVLSALCDELPKGFSRRSQKFGDDINSAIKGVKTAFNDSGGIIPVGNSAALLRILAPVLLSQRDEVVFAVGESLFRRKAFPMGKCLDFECEKYEIRSKNYIKVSGRIASGEYVIDASESSQIASGFLITCAILPGLRVRIEHAVSLPYIDLTKRMLSDFGCALKESDSGWFYTENAALKLPDDYSFQADCSYAANFIAANYIQSTAMDGPISINGNMSAEQADYAINRIISLNEVSVRNCPDLFPILCVAALKRPTDTVLKDVFRLKNKESDRIHSTKCMIEALGGRMVAFDDHIIVYGADGKLRGGTVESFDDHRIVMAAAVASLMCSEPVVIMNADAVNKSSSSFFNDFVKLGGKADEYFRN